MNQQKNYEKLIKSLKSENNYNYPYKLSGSPIGQTLINLSPEEQRDFVLVAIKCMARSTSAYYAYYNVQCAIQELLRKSLPFNESELLTLLDWSINSSHNSYRAVPQMIKAI